MKLDFNFDIKDLTGNAIKGQTAGKILAQMLSQQSKGNSLKLYDWALKLWNDKPIEIDATDSDVLLSLVESSEYLTIISKVPIMNYIKSVKEKQK